MSPIPLMKCILRVFITCFWGLFLAGCAYKDQLPPVSAPLSQIFSVSGTVRTSDGPLPSIMIELSRDGMNSSQRTVRTGADGSYRFDGLANGSYTLTPSAPGLFFTPRKHTATITDAAVRERNFSAALPLVPMITFPPRIFTFTMGSDSWGVEERPLREVTINSFDISSHEISQKQWGAVMGNNPSLYKGDDHPVEQVSWDDAVAFCNALSLREGFQPAFIITGDGTTCDFEANGYRLPTEAEWEYACRGGLRTDTYQGNLLHDSIGCFDEPVLNIIAVYCTSGGIHQRSGSKKPNALGLYDMIGNVAEWCWDWYGNYQKGDRSDPRGPQSGTLKVIRGGSAYQPTYLLRSAARASRAPQERQSGLGFRVVRSVR